MARNKKQVFYFEYFNYCMLPNYKTELFLIKSLLWRNNGNVSCWMLNSKASKMYLLHTHSTYLKLYRIEIKILEEHNGWYDIFPPILTLNKKCKWILLFPCEFHPDLDLKAAAWYTHVMVCLHCYCSLIVIILMDSQTHTLIWPYPILWRLRQEEGPPPPDMRTEDSSASVTIFPPRVSTRLSSAVRKFLELDQLPSWAPVRLARSDLQPSLPRPQQMCPTVRRSLVNICWKCQQIFRISFCIKLIR